MKAKILGIIPARGGSKGVPRKNIKLLNGKPLIAYTIEAAKRVALFDTILVSTEDKEIQEVAKNWGAEVPFLRAITHATDKASAIPMLQHVVEQTEANYNCTFDIVVMLQPTSPLKTEEDLTQALSKLVATPEADSIISVVDVEASHPARMKYLKEGYLIDPPFCEAYENQPRQELEPMYIRNGAIYATRRDVLMNKGSIKGKKSLAYIMPPERSINIDTLDDFFKAEKLLAKKNETIKY